MNIKLKNVRKYMLSFGALGGIVAPVAAVVSCGTNTTVEHYKLLPTYAGQADQLIALGIKPDYYPLQLNKTTPFAYLTDAGKFMSKSHDQAFINDFAAKVKSLVPSEWGTAWWNQQALREGESGSDYEYWTHKSGDLILYEHYLLDDGAKTINNSTAPKHTDLPSTFIQTNFRQSRDPFTRMTPAIVIGLLDKPVYDGTSTINGKAITAAEKKFIDELLAQARVAEEVSATDKAVDGKPQPTGKIKDNYEYKDGEPGSWLYNDYVFARNYHSQFIDNPEFNKSEFKDLVLNYIDPDTLEKSDIKATSNQWIFDRDQNSNKLLAKLFYESTYQSEEDDLKAIVNNDSTNQQLGSAQLNHHPIYDQQTEVGAAPMFEGAMRDNALYIYDLASKLEDASTNTMNDQAGYDKLKAAFNDNDQWKGMQKALDNANALQKDLKARLKSISELVKLLPADKKTFGIVTIAPGGQGVSTIQSSSKYSFIYRELGFNQPLPTDLASVTPASGGTAINSGSNKGDTLFNMDDNGWWWNISQQDESGSSSGIDSSRTQNFSKFDYGVITTGTQTSNGDRDDWGGLKDADKGSVAELFKDGKTDPHLSDYNLWNEGLKTPFVLHMLLDQIVDIIKADAKAAGATDAQISAAYDWGAYFTKTYLGK